MVGYFLPHPPILIDKIGKGREKECQKTLDSFYKVAHEIKEIKPDTIIIISPHAPVFSDSFFVNNSKVISGNLSRLGYKDIKMTFYNNNEFVNKLTIIAHEQNIPLAFIDDSLRHKYGIDNNLDHGAIVPLYFLTQQYSNFSLVHLSYSLLDDLMLYRFGMLLRSISETLSQNILIIASGDLSHKLTLDGPYGYVEEGPLFDRTFVELIKERKFKEAFQIDKVLAEKAGECGFRSYKVLLGFFEGYKVYSEVYSYEGPFGVGYMVARFEDKKEKDISLFKEIKYIKNSYMDNIRKNEDAYTKLARESLEYYIKHRRFLDTFPDYVTDEMLNKKAGVFVSIKKDGTLRGCIGTIEPFYENIAKEIIKNAVAAGTRDPRFYPVEEDELHNLEYHVDVLNKPEKVLSKDELDPKIYGVIVKSGYKKGLLLPDLEGIDTVEEQLRIACQKANIEYGSEDFEIERFTVERHH
ncbi:AmmeMemoRadiSam system protein A [Caldicellulosiruptoraceae bacterium PP1]